jgi:hypothetical protein
VGTLHDNEGIGTVIKGVHRTESSKHLLKEKFVFDSQREREREAVLREHQLVCSDSHQLGNQFLAGNPPKTVLYLAVCYGNLVIVVTQSSYKDMCVIQ